MSVPPNLASATVLTNELTNSGQISYAAASSVLHAAGFERDARAHQRLTPKRSTTARFTSWHTCTDAVATGAQERLSAA